MSFAVKMLDMLTSAYNRTDIIRLKESRQPQTYIGKLFSLAGWGFDIVCEQAEKVRLWDDIDKMQGVVLDRFGRDFGVERGEASDTIMRIMIKVKIMAMLAAGNLDTLILSAASLFGVRAEDVRSAEVYPAKVHLFIDEDKLDQEHKDIAAIIAGLMSRIKSGGVGLRVFYHTYHSDQAKIYTGTSVCLATFMQVLPAKIDNETVKSINLKTGTGALIYTAASYPVKQ